MPYWDMVVGSFRITWRHKYLWLLALFAGESGGGGFSYTQGARGAGPSSQNAQQIGNFLSQHAGLIVAAAVGWLVGVILLFILAAICEGALIRAAAEHDADRPFRLGMAWRNGVGTMWKMVRFRLILIVLVLPAIIVFGLLVTGFVLAIVNNMGALAVLLGVVGLLFILVLIVYAIYLSLLDRLGSRTAILEQRAAWSSIVCAHQLLVKRFGRVMLVWLISVAVGIVVGLASSVVLVVIGLPAIVAIIIIVAGGPSWLWLVFAIGALILLVVGIPLSAFLAAQSSTYWTLSFRRLDLDPQPPAASAAATAA